MFSVTSQLNWLHKVLSFICQGSKPELSVAFRSGTMYYNGPVSFHLWFFLCGHMEVLGGEYNTLRHFFFKPYLKPDSLGPCFVRKRL